MRSCPATLTLLLLLLVASAALADTIYVDGSAIGANDGSSWTDSYLDLQDALGEAASGDDIWIAAGIYKPTQDTNQSATFTLIDGVGIYGGFDGAETSLDQRDWESNESILSGNLTGNHYGPLSYYVVTAIDLGSSAVLDGITIQEGETGIYNLRSSTTVSNVTVTQCWSYDKPAILNEEGSDGAFRTSQ